MRLTWLVLGVAVLAQFGLGSADPRAPESRARHWQRQKGLEDRPPGQFVGPHVCRSRNSTHCCPGWTSRPNSLLCVVPICRPECGIPGACVAPNMCRCPGGVEAPSCGNGGGSYYPYPVRTVGGCRRICMNGGTCNSGSCQCAPGWTGEFCTQPICREPCLHGGRCIAPDRCVCFHGLSGTRCEIDRRTGPCYTETRGSLCTGALEGVVCTKQLCCATVGHAWGHPCERCTALECPPGHIKPMPNKECQDVDECAAIPGLCDGGKCINSIGSFSCECPTGQTRHPVSNNCEDIDECEDPNICPNGKCVNTDGDYYCLCNPHFIPSPDKKFCIDGRVSECFAYLSDTGECSDKLTVALSHRDCCCGYNMGRAWGELCAPCPIAGSDDWSHLCMGVSLRSSNGTSTGGHGDSWEHGNGSGGTDRPSPIAKVNECTLRPGICGLGQCVDKDVGYSCICNEGSTETTIEGNPVCIDIDECALGFCQGGTCINTNSSFECRCPPGFDPVEGGKRCSDKNECEISNGRMCTNGVCTIIDGGFECTCNPGFVASEYGQACIDVDECAADPHICRRGRCSNTPGSYHCACAAGFQLTPRGYCADIDECNQKHLCQGGRCVNSEGSFQCVCEAGYRPSADRVSCIDVDECGEQPSLCRNAKCRNTPGSFRCDCRPGYTLASDGRACRDEVQDLCYENYEDGQCQGPGSMPVTKSQCCCVSGKGRRLGWGVSCKSCPDRGSEEYSLLCPEGADKDNDGEDINECTMTPGICEHGTCENLEPGFRCLCDPGFHSDINGRCKDIDECDMHQSYCTGGQCRNTIGNFTCVCPPGTRYEPAELICRDIDECDELSNPCDNGRCINTHGGYECDCEPGYVLDPTGRHCIDNRRGSCWRRIADGSCELGGVGAVLRAECCCSLGVAWGSPCAPCAREHCACPRGHAMLDGSTCRDINECELSSDLCIGGKCVNTDGSYKCECPPGLTLDSEGNRCIDTRLEFCFTDYVGGRCTNPIQKEVHKALCCCSAVGKAWGDGRCEPCPKKGTDLYRDLCISDVRSPTSPVWDRPAGGDFIEGNGMWGNGSDSWYPNGLDEPGNQYGPDANFGPDIGPGQGGQGLIAGQLDVNECSAFPGLCGNGRCRNTPGGFECDCYPGYEQDGKNRTCVDVDECSIVAGVCGAGTCKNTPGSFKCTCERGHEPDPNTQVCKDIDECADNQALCRGGNCANTPGSFKCDCGRGMELSPDGLSCKDVDECSITSGICSNGVCENLMGTYQCVCDDGYAQSSVKSHCEDIDECGDDPDICQHNCKNTPGSYRCECRDGWRLRADGRTCIDVDECANGARVCGAGTCKNIPGSYRCECDSPGLRAAVGDRPGCADVDECQEIPDLCGAGECHNTIGSYVCQCGDGYSVKPELGPACTDDDECELGTCDCHPSATCINMPGSFQCRCNDGWRGDGVNCEDIDECVTHNGGCHPHAVCTNNDGSFNCLCQTGYKGDGYSCVDIDECANDPTLCENGHCTNTPGGYVCDCDVGFTRSNDEKSCLDMDECATFDNVCVFGTCENTYGMFKCNCDKGYQPDNSVDDIMLGFNCSDIDECKSPQSCQYGTCFNTPGSYVCRCPPDYQLMADGTACFDPRKSRCYAQIDYRSGNEECRDSDELSDDGTMAACCCSIGKAWGQYCDECPPPGSEAYRQLCPGGPGYMPVLEPPTYVVTLADIDECVQHPLLCEHGTCTNTFGSYVCTCPDGWRLSEDGLKCEDIDECASNDLCTPGLCRNMMGSYVCLCPEGYEAMPNGKECVDVRQGQCYTEYDSLSESCSSPGGVLQYKASCCCTIIGKAWGEDCERCPDTGTKERGLLCGDVMKMSEYVHPMTNKTIAIDECSIMPHLCKPGTCHDTPNGFRCGCDIGYQEDSISHQCRDVDECSDSEVCTGVAVCHNVPGGYQCRCPTGYEPSSASSNSCEDVNECQRNPHLCHHGTCTNTIGSYRCECAPGFVLRDSTCQDVDECSRPRPMCRNGTCENTPGSYRCHCHDGFKPGPNNDCIDINECREGNMVCRNGVCRNTPGSFQCACAPGYALTPDEKNCRDVDECNERREPCGEAGDPSCINTNGGYECVCGPGFRTVGKQCVDMDECRERNNVCAGGSCHNLHGGYRCECPTGWRFDEEAAICVDERKELCYDQWDRGRCHEARPLLLSQVECCCTEGSAWGRVCSPCPPMHSPDFRKLCAGGPGRTNMTQDLDECTLRPNACKGGNCINTDGSFRCSCPPGYTLDGTGLVCLDVDECTVEPRICGNGTCSNTAGGYECTCNRGFMQGSDQTCVDIDECAESRDDCMFRCHNTVGSYRCACPFGYMLAADGRHCKDVDECAASPSPCPQRCENNVGSYSCRCQDGYRRTSSPHDSPDSCEDVDECSEKDRCSNGECMNLDGGYTCECDPGYEPNENATECIDRRTGQCYRSLVSGRCSPEPWSRSLSAAHTSSQLTKAQCCCTLGVAWGADCELCPAVGSHERDKLCTAENLSPIGKEGGQLIGGGGINGGGTDELGDVDECAAMPDLCAPGRCVNTFGSFRCVCGAGYKPSGDSCVDVDECSIRPSPCQHHCTNTEGSYNCLCRHGYELDVDGGSCIDVDECERESHTCQQRCENTDGSYQCSCEEGYEQRGDACIDINECLEDDACPYGAKCTNLVGSFRCACGRGARLDQAGQRCLPLERCANGECRAPCATRGPCNCPPGTIRSASGACIPPPVCSRGECGAADCSPAGGAYRCSCPIGYHWDAAHLVCLQSAGGCAGASCLFGCESLGSNYRCGCPTGYRLVGAGHCLSALDSALPLDDIGDAPVFPVGDQYKVGNEEELLSTEGCFSCKLNGRRKRAPDEAIIYANGTTVLRRRKRRNRNRRALLEPDVELIVVQATPRQTWSRSPLLRLLPSEGEAKPHYRISHGNDDKFFILNKRDGAWALRLRKHLKQKEVLDTQLELEARFVPLPNLGKTRNKRQLSLNIPPPLKLYVSIRIAPQKR